MINFKDINLKPFLPILSSKIEKLLFIFLILWLPLKDFASLKIPAHGNLFGYIIPFLIFVLLFLRWARAGLKLRFGSVEIAFIIFLFFAVVSGVLSVLTYGAYFGVIKDTAVLFEFLALYIYGSNLKKDELSLILKIGIFEAILIAFYGIWQYWTKAPIPDLWIVPGEVLRTRAYAFFSSPNALAVYLLSWFWVSIIFASQKKKFYLGALVMAVALIFTYSRGAIIALGEGCLYVILTSGLSYGKKIVVVGTGAFMPIGVIWRRIIHIFDPTYLSYTEEAGRLWAVKNVFYILPHHLFYGVGMGMYGGETAAATLSPVYLESIQHGMAATKVTDNQYLQFLIELGIFGLIAYLVLIAVIFKNLYNKVKENRIWSVSVLALFLGYNFEGFFENIWFIPAPTVIIWLLIGFLAQKEEKR